MSKQFNPSTTAWTRPAQGSISITAGAGHLVDASGAEVVIRGLYLGTSGDVTVTHPDGSSGEFVGLVAGVVHPIAATHVTAIATATDVRGII